MASRLDLHEILCDILGSRNVYFQPPASVKMSYDAIVYSRDTIENKFADDSVYMQNNRYEIVVIYRDPDSELPKKISRLPGCSHSRHYVADNLYHDAFNLYY